MYNLLQFFREQMEIWDRIPYTLERNGIPFVRECTVDGFDAWLTIDKHKLGGRGFARSPGRSASSRS